MQHIMFDKYDAELLYVKTDAMQVSFIYITLIELVVKRSGVSVIRS
jgi:hypothetical protein